jgi:hypothetical protein
VLDAMVPDAERFHREGRLVDARDMVAAKRKELQQADDVEVARWAAQSVEQRRIVGGASAGLAVAVTQLEQLLSTSKKQASDELPDAVKKPLFELADAYVGAAAQSLLVSTGAAALTAADERSRMFNVELMEGILRAVAHDIETAEKDKTGEKEGGNEGEFGISKLRAREEELRKRLGAAREGILRNPDQIADVLEKIHADVADLQTEVAIVSNLDAIDTAQKALFDSQDWLNDIWAQEAELRQNHLDEVNGWRTLWSKVYAAWKKGDHADAITNFQILINQEGYRTLFERTAGYVKDAAAWALVSRLVTLIAITALTMGVGIYATGFAATAWGGAAAAAGELTAGAVTAGFIGGTVAEAATFTVLNRFLLEPSQTWKGFLGEFGWNLLLFGSLRKLSMLYRGAAAVKAAVAAGRTILVAAGDMTIAYATLNVANIARAEVEKRLADKGNLSPAEIETILLQSAAMFIGMSVFGRVTEPFMTEVAASGSTAGARARLIGAQRSRLAAIAEELSVTGDVARARALITEDQAELQSEIDFYEQVLQTPEVLAKAGYSPEQILGLRLLGGQQIAEIGVTEAMIGAKQEGNVYELPKEQLARAVEAHRKAGATVTPLRMDDDIETWHIKPLNGREITLTTLVPNRAQTQLSRMRAGLSPEGQEAFDRLVSHAIAPEGAVEQMNKMLLSPKGLEASVKEAANKLPIEETVAGLYAGVKLDNVQGPWKFDTQTDETEDPDGTREFYINTDVTLTMPDGTTHAGNVTRTVTLRPNAAGSYDVDLTMNMAFLESIPKEERWVKEGAVPLKGERGTPLQTYVTLMQMRRAGVQLGQVKDAHLSRIVNARTSIELEVMRRKYAPGVHPQQLPSKLIEQTQSGTYGMTNVVQAGGKVKSMRIEGGREVTVNYAVRGSEMDDDVKLKELGLSRTDKVWYSFDIVIDIEPPQMPPTAPMMEKK